MRTPPALSFIVDHLGIVFDCPCGETDMLWNPKNIREEFTCSACGRTYRLTLAVEHIHSGRKG